MAILCHARPAAASWNKASHCTWKGRSPRAHFPAWFSKWRRNAFPVGIVFEFRKLGQPQSARHISASKFWGWKREVLRLFCVPVFRRIRLRYPCRYRHPCYHQTSLRDCGWKSWPGIKVKLLKQKETKMVGKDWKDRKRIQLVIKRENEGEGERGKNIKGSIMLYDHYLQIYML